jgi:sugar phosphate permease
MFTRSWLLIYFSLPLNRRSRRYNHGWDAGFMLIAGSCVAAILLIALTWKAEQRSLGHE